MTIVEQLYRNHRALIGGLEPAAYLLITVFGITTVYYTLRLLIWFGSLLVRGDSRERILHPDNFPDGSPWRERAETLLANFESSTSAHNLPAASSVADCQPEDPVVINLGEITRRHERTMETGPRQGPPRCTNSAKTSYQLVEQLGAGDVAEVYVARRADRLCLLKIARSASCNRWLSKEVDVLERLLSTDSCQGLVQYVAAPQGMIRWGDRRATVFPWREEFVSADQVLRDEGPYDSYELGWIFDSLLEALGYVHRAGWTHGAVLPPHILLDRTNQRLLLLGWIHAERQAAPLRVVARRFKDWYPLECQRRRTATPATDIYLAAKCMVMLAGGTPPFDHVPPQLPVEMRRLMAACLLESQRMRPQDAWQLRQEIADSCGSLGC